MRGSQRWALVKQLIFGVDTTSAFLICTVFGMVFMPHPGFLPAVGYLLLAGFGNYLPDLDMMPYLLFRKRFNWESHWDVGGHFWLIVLPIASAITFLAVQAVGVGNPIYATTIMSVCIVAHIVHDATWYLGFPVLAPFNKGVYITLHYGWPRILNGDLFHEHESKINEQTETADTIEVLAANGEPTTIWHVIVWMAAVGLFCYWVVA